MVGLFVAMLVASVGGGVAAASTRHGPPPWAPGPGGTDVVHGIGRKPATAGGSSTSPLLSYRGGAVQAGPTVYLVLWGSQWANDPAHEAPYLANFLGGLYGSADSWSTSTTQYCQGVASGATSCAAATSGNVITHPSTTPVLGVWSDNATAAPSHPRQSQLAAEAVRAAKHFAALPGFDVKAQFVIATAHNNNATGFGSSYCAWHSSTSYNGGYIAYTNLPYIPDAGGACGANFVNSPGALDGVSIVAGHEYAESVTDPFPNSGWLDANGSENGDKCAWISSGQGAATNVPTANGSFPVQSLWSNNFTTSTGAGGCVTRYVSATNQG